MKIRHKIDGNYGILCGASTVPKGWVAWLWVDVSCEDCIKLKNKKAIDRKKAKAEKQNKNIESTH